jgi:hypothetical protein
MPNPDAMAVSVGPGEGELAGVEVEMPAGVAVDVFERHVLTEERIPSRRVVHAASEVVV